MIPRGSSEPSDGKVLSDADIATFIAGLVDGAVREGRRPRSRWPSTSRA